MPAMDKYFSVLEGHTDIDGDSIRVSLPRTWWKKKSVDFADVVTIL